MTHASLFSGIGGFDIAAEWAGWDNVFNCEIAEDFGVSKSTVLNIVHGKGFDGITFSKWRAEAIKAYGNAIVPQVAYRIFDTINKYERL